MMRLRIKIANYLEFDLPELAHINHPTMSQFMKNGDCHSILGLIQVLFSQGGSEILGLRQLSATPSSETGWAQRDLLVSMDLTIHGSATLGSGRWGFTAQFEIFFSSDQC
jgi:hypothetical protein